MDTDLFGNKIKREETKTEWYLRQKDEQTMSSRVSRLEYLHKLNPEGLIFSGQLELVLSYRELQDTYINGHFLSVILLGQSWIEKILHSHLESLGLKSVTKKGFAFMTQYCQDNQLVDDYLTKKMNKFRLIRNPVSHLKSDDYEHDLSKRAFRNQKNPMTQLELDAKEIIEICGHVAKHGLKK